MNLWKRQMKNIIFLMVIVFVMAFSMGCQKGDSVQKETISQEDYEKLPEDQQDSELDRALAEVRHQKKEEAKGKGGMSRAPSGINLPGYVKDPNNFSTKELEDIFEAIFAYLEKKGIDTKENVTIGDCYDPRMNKLYKDDDKGVAKGYENKDIFVAEYENKEEGVYQYLIVVRDQIGSWKVLHDGTSYKE